MKIEEGTAAVPAARRHIIRRPRLTRMLDESGARIILLVAPAGYGKTTLAREWLEDPSRRAAWYRGGPASSDVAALSVGLAAAAAEIVPGAGDRMRERLKATDRPEEDTTVLAEMLAEDLTEWPDDAWLIIDDYQFIAGVAPAESFVRDLLGLTQLRLIVTSRKRPAWAAARQRAYGEILEVGRVSMSLSSAEAANVLGSVGQTSPAVVERAQGWPAVVGLAAISGEFSFDDQRLPTTLLDFFAEELYQAASSSLRRTLCQLAIAPSLTLELLEYLFGSDKATRIVDQATALGFFTEDVTHEPEIHPLLKRFLGSKLGEHDRSSVQRYAYRLGEFYLARRQWDEVFTVATHLDDVALVVGLLRAGLEDVLSLGRISTVAQWVEFATDRYANDPILDLAEAELEFRRGAHPQTRILASRAARSLEAEGSAAIAAVAHARAGRAAHFEGRPADALAHHDAAIQLTQRPETAREALWGKFVTLVESGDTQRAESALLALEKADEGYIDDALRLASGRYLLSAHAGRTADIDALLEAVPLLERCASPMVRSSFLNSCVGGLTIAARYAEADELAKQQINEAETYRLRFALPHGYIRRAGALCGLRQFREAFQLLTSADRLAQDVDHEWIRAAAAITRGLTFLAVGDPQSALEATDEEPGTKLGPALQGEYLAFRALAFACRGDLTTSGQLRHRAESHTRALEASSLCAFARAVSAHHECSTDADAITLQAFRKAVESQALDYFVVAYRACPSVLRSVVDADHSSLSDIVERARDHDLAKTVGLQLARHASASSDSVLSPRERDVWELLALGLSNREIASRLFVSESTAKVHVRHIFEKLGARSRVDAVLKGQALFG